MGEVLNRNSLPMKRAFLISLVSFSCFCLKAQPNLDSLYSIWQDEAKTYSSRVDAFSLYIKHGFSGSNPDSAFVLADQLITISIDKKDLRGQAEGYFIQAITHDVKANYSESIKLYNRSLGIWEELKAKGGISKTLSNLGMIYGLHRNFQKALKYYNKALPLVEELNDPNEIRGMLLSFGNIYRNLEDYSKASEYYQRALAVAEEAGNRRMIASVRMGLGSLYGDRGEYTQGIEQFELCLAYYKDVNSIQGTSYSLVNLGEIYQMQGDYPKALDYYRQGSKMLKEAGNQYGYAYVLVGIGKVYQDQNLHKSALEYCNEALMLLDDIGIMEAQQKACECLYNSNKALGRGSEALVYLEKLQAINDSLNFNKTTKELQQMEFQKQVVADSLAQVETDRLVQEAHERR